MLLASWSVALAGVPLASAHEAEDVISWPLSGSNDTGWVQLDALVGSDIFYPAKPLLIGFLNLRPAQKSPMSLFKSTSMGPMD